MTLAELTPWLFARVPAGVQWGLERTERLLAGVGNPHRLFRSMLIGGTNGKGSVAALCDAALRADGQRRVGLYTSPHLVSFTERIRIDGVPVEEGALVRAAERLRPAIEAEGASFFEATTALAFLLFAEAGVEMAVVEVGLGGRLDATNVLDPLVSVVTNVSRDHTDYLGEDLPGIAREKSGIFRSGRPALIGEEDEAIVQVLVEEAASRGAEVVVWDRVAAVSEVESDLAGTRFTLRDRHRAPRRLGTPLIGAHQVRNAGLAAMALARLPAEDQPSADAVERGFATVRWPGRMQVERIRGTTWLLDVAHNPAGANALAASLDALDFPRPLVLVASILADKDWQRMLLPLLARVGAAILTDAPSAPESRRWRIDEVAAWCREEAGAAPRVIPDLSAALSRASTLAPHGTVVVTGSVHTVGDALAGGLAAIRSSDGGASDESGHR